MRPMERIRRNRAMSNEEKQTNLLAHPVKGTLLVVATMAVAGALVGALELALDLTTVDDAVRRCVVLAVGGLAIVQGYIWWLRQHPPDPD